MAYIQERTAQDGTIRYRVQVRLKRVPTQTATFKRKTDAKQWAQQTEAAIREGRHFKTTEAKRHTLGEMIDRYVREVLPGKPRSAYNYRLHLRWWKERLGSVALADATPSLIAEYRDRLAREETQYGRPRTPATVNRYLAALSHAFTVAVKEWGWLDDTPMRKVTKPREPRGRVRFLSDDERRRLLDSCRQSWTHLLYPIVVVALSTGARKNEILQLRWDQVDLERGRITLDETKNGERRVLPLVEVAFDEMWKLSRTSGGKSIYCFPRRDGKQPLDIRKAWAAALQWAKIDDFTFHDLRHSCASYLAMNGATLPEIAEILGHKTLAMVKRYTHLSEQHTAGVLARMNEKIFRSEP